MIFLIANTAFLFPILFFLCIVLVFGMIIFRNLRQAKKRREQLATLASDMGFEYQPKALTLSSDDFESLPLFQSGRGHAITNLMKTQLEEIPVQLFDYRYTTGSGKNATTYQHAVAAFALPEASLPYFQLQPENFFFRIASKFGYQDIDFESHPKFSKQYVLRGKDEQAIRNYFTDEKLWFLESRADLLIQGGGQWLVVYRKTRFKPQEFKKFLEDSWGILMELT